ncbi:MAG: hypothetical protein ACETWK_00350 [Candidatus Aminicenantaceae bacterium]
MRLNIKKFVSLLLIFSLMPLSWSLAAKERRGAELIIQRIEGIQLRGELIAVKRNSLLLMEYESAATQDIPLDEIDVIRVVKESKAGKWTFYGLILGGGIGALSGYTADPDALPSREVSAVIGAVVFGLSGALLGKFVSEAAGKDVIFRVRGRPASRMVSELEYLRKNARITDYR